MQNLSSSPTNLFAARQHVLGSEPARQDSALYHVLKRVLDMGITLLGLLTLWPLFLLIAVLIKLDSPGPIFFVQQRVGARRRVRDSQVIWEVQPFHILKFRSMVHNADESPHVEHIK